MKQHKYALSGTLAGVGLLCLAATSPLWAQGGPSVGGAGDAARAGVGNQATNNTPGADGEGGNGQNAPGDDASFNDNGSSDAMQQAYKDYSQKKFSAATPELQAILKKSPNTVEAHEMLASIYTIQNQVPQAIPELEAVVRLKPKEISFRDNLGVAYLQTGNPSKAASEFQTLLSQHPTDVTYAFQYATALEQGGSHAEAAAAFEKAATLNPKDSQAPLYAGLVYHEIGNDAKAVPDLKSALALGTTHKFEAYTALAEAANTAKQSNDAIGYYLQAAQAKPTDFGTEYNLGVVQQNAGKKADAEATYRQALTLKSDDPKAYAAIQENLAGLLKSDGKLDEAATLLTQAAQTDPTSVYVQDSLGSIYEKQGKKDLALAAYKQALTLKPGNGVAKEGVARLSKP